MTSLADYELKQKLGAGSFGTVYKAIRKSDGKPVVVKQVRKRLQFAHASLYLSLYLSISIYNICTCVSLTLSLSLSLASLSPSALLCTVLFVPRSRSTK